MQTALKFNEKQQVVLEKQQLILEQGMALIQEVLALYDSGQSPGPELLAKLQSSGNHPNTVCFVSVEMPVLWHMLRLSTSTHCITLKQGCCCITGENYHGPHPRQQRC